MTKRKFLKIINNIFFPVIEETTKTSVEFEIIGKKLKQIICDSKLSIHKEYQDTKKYFKKNYMKKPTYIDRFKIAALLYVAFAKITKDNKFFTSKDNALKYLFVHRVAFNMAISIIENFIYADKKKHGASYCLYIQKHGIIEKTSDEAQRIINKLIEEHKENKLSTFAIINVLNTIEYNSKIRFKKYKKN